MATMRSNKERLPPSCTLKGHGKEPVSHHIPTRQEYRLSVHLEVSSLTVGSICRRKHLIFFVVLAVFT